MPAKRKGLSYKSKFSFQYGFSVRLLTVVVLVCSPLMVATAKGSGRPERLVSSVAAGQDEEDTYGRHPSCRDHQRR